MRKKMNHDGRAPALPFVRIRKEKAMLYTEIERFCPYTPEETDAKKTLLALIQQYGDAILERSCEAGHITCSGWILSPDLSKALMAYHLIYGSVGWTGGHADGDADLLGTALREAREETSVKEIIPFSRRILSIDILPVPPHQKHGKKVAEHLHYNVTYGFLAAEGQPLADKPDENRDVRWVSTGEIAQLCTEPHMLPIYAKLTERMQQLAARKRSVPEAMLQSLLAWYPSHKRDLPWRRDKAPYHVWVSEIMLQQTRVEAVKGYYARFLETLPDVQALAQCPEETLLKLWEGLGYYNRVRNMQKAAQCIVSAHGGVFPKRYEEIHALPGIGDYTAGAVSSICFGLPTPAVDGNVLRVLARLQEDFRNVLEPKVKSDMTAALAKVYPHADAGMLTQALMEIGATVCVPNGAPHCSECPLRMLCLAREAGSETLLPVRLKKTKRRTEQRTVFVLECDGKTAIRKRHDKGLLASLWELPSVEGFLTPEEAAAQVSAWGAKPAELLRVVQRKHIFTHITWEMQGVFLQCTEPCSSFVWADAKELEGEYALPTAFRCVLD